jgi:phage shock protein A
MAGSGVFARLRNLWSGFVSLWISDLEKEHPEIAYENAINALVGRYAGLKKATAGIIRRRDEIQTRLAQQNKELAQVSAELSVAIEGGQDDLAIVLVQKKQQLEASLAELRADAESSVKDADSAKASLLQVEAEIRRLKAEKDTMLAKMQSAQAKIRINEQLDGLSVDAEVKALDNVRQHIQTVVAEANLNQELKETSLDTRLAALREKTGEVGARQELDRLKAAMAAKKTQKTM